jgi:hypothetical protein
MGASIPEICTLLIIGRFAAMYLETLQQRGDSSLEILSPVIIFSFFTSNIVELKALMVTEVRLVPSNAGWLGKTNSSFLSAKPNM